MGYKREGGVFGELDVDGVDAAFLGAALAVPWQWKVALAIKLRHTLCTTCSASGLTKAGKHHSLCVRDPAPMTCGKTVVAAAAIGMDFLGLGYADWAC